MADDLFEQGKVIYNTGRQIPISEVTWNLMCDPKSLFPIKYDMEELPLETQGAAMLAPIEIKRLLGLEADKGHFKDRIDLLKSAVAYLTKGK